MESAPSHSASVRTAFLPSLSPTTTPPSKTDATAGRIFIFGFLVIAAILCGKLDLPGWIKPAPAVGRYQVVSGRVRNTFTPDEVATMIKVDTLTGKSWVMFPAETSSGSMNLMIPNRWENVNEADPSPPPASSGSEFARASKPK